MLNQSSKQSLLSTGNETFDRFLGGGLLSSVLNLFEREGPTSRIIDSILIKSLTCASLTKKHSVLYVNLNTENEINERDVLSSLPSNRQVKSEMLFRDIRKISTASTIKIAWRYSQREVSSPSDAFHKLNQVDFGVPLTKDTNINDIGLLRVLNIERDANASFIIEKIERDISKLRATDSNVIVIIKDLLHPFSPFIGKKQDLLKFLYALRCLSRKLDSTMMICYDCELCPEYNSIKRQIYNLVDSVVVLHSYQTDEAKPAGYKDIDGTLCYIKVPKVNSYGFHFQRGLSDWGYRLTKNRRYFVVDELSLPPCEDSDGSGLQCTSKHQTDLTELRHFSRPLERANPLEEFRDVAKDILPKKL